MAYSWPERSGPANGARVKGGPVVRELRGAPGRAALAIVSTVSTVSSPAFLMRNYRADHGKWLTADPMGYPDGWNQMAYCGNSVTRAVDFLGPHPIPTNGRGKAFGFGLYENEFGDMSYFKVYLEGQCNHDYYNPVITPTLVYDEFSDDLYDYTYDGIPGMVLHFSASIVDSEIIDPTFATATKDIGLRVTVSCKLTMYSNDNDILTEYDSWTRTGTGELRCSIREPIFE